MTTVLDASALLALLWGEAGSATVADAPTPWAFSAVNYAEVASKLIDRGFSDDAARIVLAGLKVTIHPFTAAHAADAGLLRAATRHLGLSLGDRACLALARDLGSRVMTADRAWTALDLGVPVDVIR